MKFQDNSKKVKAEMQQVSELGLEKALLLIEGSAKTGTPVLTGNLRDSINHNTKKSGTQIIGQVGTPLQHGIYVEFGTGEYAENGAGRKGGWVYQDASGEWFFTWGQEPQPFMRNAFRRNKANIKKVLSEEYSAKFKGK